MDAHEAWARSSGDALIIDDLKMENAELRTALREYGEFVQKVKRDIRDFLDHPSLGS